MPFLFPYPPPVLPPIVLACRFVPSTLKLSLRFSVPPPIVPSLKLSSTVNQVAKRAAGKTCLLSMSDNEWTTSTLCYRGPAARPSVRQSWCRLTAILLACLPVRLCIKLEGATGPMPHGACLSSSPWLTLRQACRRAGS